MELIVKMGCLTFYKVEKRNSAIKLPSQTWRTQP